MRVPTGDARDAPPLHRVVAADEVFDGATDEVVKAGAAVRRGRTFVEDERLAFLVSGERLAKEILGTPSLQHRLFDVEQALR